MRVYTHFYCAKKQQQNKMNKGLPGLQSDEFISRRPEDDRRL